MVIISLPISVFVKCSDAKLKSQLVPLTSAIATLAYCSKVDFDQAPPSSGCAILPVSDKCEVHLVLQVRKDFWSMNHFYSMKIFVFQGLIDPSKELIKLAKRQEQLNTTVSKLEKDASKADYESKVPEEVRVANKEKLDAAIGELAKLKIAEIALKEM
jgi:valyl-tRNA synthetase